MLSHFGATYEALARLKPAFQEDGTLTAGKASGLDDGAAALRHRIGASGSLLLVTLLYEMRRRNLQRGLASQCLGAGQTIALIVARWPNPARWTVEINSIVILSLTAPKEKVWGQLVALGASGVTVRGIELESFDDFVRQILEQEDVTVGLATLFFPMHRVERIAQDEPSGTIPSLSDRFREKVGLTVQEYLGLETPRL